MIITNTKNLAHDTYWAKDFTFMISLNSHKCQGIGILAPVSQIVNTGSDSLGDLCKADLGFQLGSK